MSSEHPFAAAWRDPEWRAQHVALIKQGIKKRRDAGLPFGRPKKVVEQVVASTVEQKDPT